MKPLDFSCVLKVSKGEREQSGFIDAIVEQCYAGMLTYLAHNSNKIGFPELVTPMLMQLKVFIKTCNRGGYAKIFKQLIEKVTWFKIYKILLILFQSTGVFLDTKYLYT